MNILISCGFTFLAVLSLTLTIIGTRRSFYNNSFVTLIGIRTPNTMASREAWHAAHKTASPFFAFITLYFIGYAVAVLVVPSLQPTEHVSINTIGALLVGLAMFLGVVAIGDHAAQTQIARTSTTTNDLPEIESPSDKLPTTSKQIPSRQYPQKTTLMHRPRNPLDYD